MGYSTPFLEQLSTLVVVSPILSKSMVFDMGETEYALMSDVKRS